MHCGCLSKAEPILGDDDGTLSHTPADAADAHSTSVGCRRHVRCASTHSGHRRIQDRHDTPTEQLRGRTSCETLKLKLGACGLDDTPTANGFLALVRLMRTLSQGTPSARLTQRRCSRRLSSARFWSSLKRNDSTWRASKVEERLPLSTVRTLDAFYLVGSRSSTIWFMWQGLGLQKYWYWHGGTTTDKVYSGVPQHKAGTCAIQARALSVTAAGLCAQG